MTARRPVPDPGSGSTFAPTRRELLRWLAYGTAGVGAGLALPGCSSDGEAATNSATTTTTDLAPRNAPRGPGERVLVVVELGGGNDGLSTLVPFEAARYHELRPTLALGGADVVDIGGGYGVNRLLGDLHDAGLAVVAGIGSPNPDLSHFEMLDRWWNGKPAGMSSQEKASLRAGFLGRLCDAVRGDERFTGISLQYGSAAALRSDVAVTTGLPPLSGSFLDDDQRNGAAFGRYLRSLSGDAGETGMLGAARAGTEHLLWILDLIEELAPPSTGYPDTEFGMQMAIASRVIRSDSGVRIVHVPMGSSVFDTHAKHQEVYPGLLTDLNAGVAAFLADLDHNGLSDDVLVATTSEFGRRPAENDGGLDHGAASVMMMLGPVVAGLHGEPSPIEALDPVDNLVATMTFDRYLASMAAWMRVDPAQVLPPADGRPAPSPIDGLLSV